MKRNKISINFKWIILTLGIVLTAVLVRGSKKEDESILSFKQESNHFKFYSRDEDEKILDNLEKSLDDNYERISKDLGVKLERKVNVNIYPDIKSFHDVIGMSDAEDWLVGLARNGEILMVSPLNPGSVHTYDSLMKVIVHEYAHILVGEITNDTYTYLNEGIAVVESNQFDETMKEYLKYAIKLNKLPSIDDMEKKYSNLEQPYITSGGFVEFLVNNYGYDKVTKIIAEPKSLENVTELSKDKLFENWKEYITENY